MERDKFNKREKIESYALPIRPQPINVNKKKGWTNGFKGVGKVSPSILLFRLLTSSSTMGKEMKSSCWSMKKKVEAFIFLFFHHVWILLFIKQTLMGSRQMMKG
jgi:hypothetical protein